MTNNQLDFAFVAELPVLPVPPKRARRSTRLSPASQASAQPANPVPLVVPPNPSGIEAMAVTLESHPDYRVIRRLKPRLEWPAAGEQGVCRVVVLDTETTGLDQSRDKIMELALLRVDVDLASGLPVGAVQVYDGLEDPGMPIPREVQEITGITPAMVQGQRLDEVRIAELLAGADLVIAHNAGFDRPFAEARLDHGLAHLLTFPGRRKGADPPSWKAWRRNLAGSMTPTVPKWIAMRYWPCWPTIYRFCPIRALRIWWNRPPSPATA